MNTNQEDKIEQIISVSESINLQELDSYLAIYLNRKIDRNLALVELDNLITLTQSKMLSISIRIKQGYLNKQKDHQPAENSLLKRKEIAKKCGVDIRTVDNWIKDGLETVPMGGGGVRITLQAVEEFSKKNMRKKMHWKSVVR